MKPEYDAFFNGLDEIREGLKVIKAGLPPQQKHVPNWDLHEKRLDELEYIARFGTEEDAERFKTLHEDFTLEYQADMAAAEADVSERLVRFFDAVADQGQKKLETLTPRQQQALERLTHIYNEGGLREMFMKILPQDTRKELDGE